MSFSFYQAGKYLVVPLSLNGIHFVGLPAEGAFVKVPAPDPAPVVTEAAVVRTGEVVPGTVTPVQTMTPAPPSVVMLALPTDKPPLAWKRTFSFVVLVP